MPFQRIIDSIVLPLDYLLLLLPFSVSLPIILLLLLISDCAAPPCGAHLGGVAQFTMVANYFLRSQFKIIDNTLPDCLSCCPYPLSLSVHPPLCLSVPYLMRLSQ